MSKKDYYEILGIDRNATAQEIKKAFRRKAMEFHPDKNKSVEAEGKFKEINEAYETLSDDNKKARYDQFGHQAFEQGFGNGYASTGFNFDSFAGFEDLGDLFNTFFGGNSSSSQRKGGDFQLLVEISFEDSVFGKKMNRRMAKFENGQRVTKQTEIKIPAGIREGQTVLIRGYGDKGFNGGQNGDLYLVIKIKHHKHYKRINNDIYLTIPISIFEIMNEEIIIVPTPYGNEKIKLDSSYTSSSKVKISNKGFVSLSTGAYGDLIAEFDIYIPKLSQKDREDIRKITSTTEDKKYRKWLKDF